MKKILILLCVTLILVIGIFVLKQQQRSKYIAQVSLAKELNKSMSAMMKDFIQVGVDSIQNVPADNAWRESILINSQSRGELKYFVRDHRLFRQNMGLELVIADNMDKVLFRRLQSEPEVLEVQVQSKNREQLKSNFRIRLKG